MIFRVAALVLLTALLHECQGQELKLKSTLLVSRYRPLRPQPPCLFALVSCPFSADLFWAISFVSLGQVQTRGFEEGAAYIPSLPACSTSLISSREALSLMMDELERTDDIIISYPRIPVPQMCRSPKLTRAPLRRQTRTANDADAATS